ncbi:MAG: AraC family transcriptional regulator [Granulosicoccus sp.]|nr:AraC family transcriptional regulator [Granulosicoccus sp.]
MPDPASTNEHAPLTGDPVSDVLETVRLKGAVFFLWEPTWPYGTGVADGRRLSRHFLPGSECVVSYHIVTKGPCWASAHGEEPIRLETGDTLLLPRGTAYKIADTPQLPTVEDETASLAFFEAMSGSTAPPVVTNGGPGPEKNSLICGFLGCDIGPFNPLLASLPGMLRVPAPEGDDPLSGLVDFALSESRESRGGERCLLLRLSEVMFVEVVRRYLRSAGDDKTGWLVGLRDPLVGRALALLHADLTTPWTVQDLADQLGASRSTLADHFSRVMGMPPMQYLAQWRIQVAANRLRESQDKIYAIASAVGYRSEEAFSRAFKRVTGVAPATWRKVGSN